MTFLLNLSLMLPIIYPLYSRHANIKLFCQKLGDQIYNSLKLI